jgi:hypothetical protein
MTTTIWEHCVLDSNTQEILSEIEKSWIESSGTNLNSLTETNSVENHSNDEKNSILAENQSEGSITQSELHSLEQICDQYLQKVDFSLQLISEISKEYHDVTSRTNILIQRCENLLEQQVCTQNFV